jgi:S-methylmethionine-dependent homocysteine/selenocysteine methylase
MTALTFTGAGEAIGFVRAVRDAGVPVAVGFTVETDGRLPDGTTLRDAVARVDAAAAPDYYVVNCAHPTHVAPALANDDGSYGLWLSRIEGLRPNASRMSHAELDEAPELDEGDPADLAARLDDLRAHLPNLRVVGGCCGTDSRHVAALWGV